MMEPTRRTQEETTANMEVRMSTQTKSSSRPWLVFIGCCVLSLVGFGLIVNTPGLYFTVLGETLNVSRTQIALASSIMAIAGAVTMLFAGKVMKMLDSRILISVCIAGVAALFLAQSFFNAVWQFYISFALMGILYVIPISLAPSVLLANWFESKLGMVMGIALGLSGIGGTIFNPVVSWFITNLGWQTSYRLTALILVICILPFSLLVFKFRPDEAKGEQAYGHIVSAAVADDAQAAGELPGIESKKAYRTPTFVLLVLVSVLLQIVAALVQHVSSHEIAHGLTLEQGALVVSGIMFGAAIGKATIGILLDYLKPELTIVIYSAIGLAGWVSWPSPPRPPRPSPPASWPDSAKASCSSPCRGSSASPSASAITARSCPSSPCLARSPPPSPSPRMAPCSTPPAPMCRRWSAIWPCTWSPRPAWSSDSVCARSRKSRSRPSEAGQNRFQTNVYIRNIRSIHE